jgi:Glycosyl transferase family group 2
VSCIYNVPADSFGTIRSFLRWQAVQDAAFIDRDGKEKIWSESHVSEDFDMALRLQMRGYIIRWATYSKGGFKEGVSLTVDDELNRWQKYAYGECWRSHFRLFSPTTDECTGCSECVEILSQLVLCANH